MADASVRIVFSGDAAGAQRAVRGLEGSFLSLGKVAKAALAVGAGVVLTRALREAGKAAISFDQGMRNVNSLAKLSESQLASLSKRVLALAGPTAQAPKTLADGLYDIVSSGFEANDAVKILAVSAKAATAGMSDTATATKAVVAVLNAYNLGADDARHVSDVLFQTVNKGVLTFEELASSVGDVLPFAAQLGVNIEDVGGAMATMTLQGLSAAESATRLKGLLVTMIQPGDELAGTIKQLGFESGEAMLKQKGLVETVRLLDQAANHNKETLGTWFPNIRALGGFLALSGDQMERFTAVTQSMDRASQGAGATARAFAEQSKSLAFQWDRAKASLAAAAIPIVQLLFPALTKGADAVARFAQSVSSSLPQIKQQFGTIAGVVGDVAKSLFNFGKTDIGVSLGAAVLSMVGLSKAAGAARGAISGLMGLKFGGWAAVGLGAVGLLAGALTYLSQQGDRAEDAILAVKTALDRLKGVGDTVAQNTDAYTAALTRREHAELGVRQALRNRELVEQSITAGEVRGKDAALARAGAELAVQDAFRERNQATQELWASMDRLAESQRREQTEAQRTQQEVGRLVDTFTNFRDALNNLEQRRAAGEFVDPRQVRILREAADNGDEFARALEGARQAAHALASDPSATEVGRKTAAGIEKALAAIQAYVKETGKVPDKLTTATILKDNGVPKKLREIIQDMLDLDSQHATPDVKVPSAARAKSDIEDVTAALRTTDRTNARPTVSVKDAATSVIRAIQSALNGLRDRTVTVTTYYRTRRNALAGGGFVPGPDTGGRDSVPAILAPGEVVLNRAQQNVLGGPGFFARTFGFSTAGVPGVQGLAGGGFVSAGQAGKALAAIIKRDKKNSGYKAQSKAVTRLAHALDANRTKQDNLARSISQDIREADISVEEFIKVDADGNETLDTGAVQQRVGEINQLLGRYQQLLGLVDEETAILKQLIEALEAAIKAWQAEIRDQERVIRETTALIQDATKKMNAATDQGVKNSYQQVISRAERTRDNARSKIQELRGEISTGREDRAGYRKDRDAQQYDRRDVELDVKELEQERTDVLAIRPRPPEPTSSVAESEATAAGAEGFSSGGTGGTEDQDKLAALEALNAELRRMVGQLKLALGLQNVQSPVIAAFQRGTLHVPQTGPYMLHGGERVVPAGFRRTSHDTVAGGDIRVIINVADGMEWLKRFIDVRVDRGAGRVSDLLGREADRRFRAGESGALAAPFRTL